eukprot:5875961-Amphidinium_carterae.1
MSLNQKQRMLNDNGCITVAFVSAAFEELEGGKQSSTWKRSVFLMTSSPSALYMVMNGNGTPDPEEH